MAVGSRIEDLRSLDGRTSLPVRIRAVIRARAKVAVLGANRRD
jgi:hypothetical protein